MSQPASAQRTIEWTRRNIGAGVAKVAKWDRAAGFGTGTAWCGIFLGAAMEAQGLKPPAGFAAAHNWSGYGTKVSSISQARPGDILVYGSNHVAMYLGNGRQIQGNNSNGTVGESGVGSSLGLGPITAIRRPRYKSGSQGESSGKTDYGGGPLGFANEFIFGDPLEALDIGSGNELKEEIKGPGAKAASDIAGKVISDLFGAIHPEALMLNIALLGGGAFLVYYGAALMLGVKSPGAKLGLPVTKGPIP